MSRTFSISDLAKEFSITTRTIRFYEAEGLLQPQRQGQTRIYAEKDRVHLMLILRGKRLGFSLAESKQIIALYDPATDNREQTHLLLQKIEQRQQLLNQQLQDIRHMQEELEAVKERLLSSHSESPSVE